MRRALPTSQLCVYALAVSALGVAVVRTPPKPWPCERTFEMVREGMTLAEVQATVGGPPGTYTSDDAICLWSGRRVIGPEVRSTADWVCDEAELCVDFAADGGACKVWVGPSGFVRFPGRWERVHLWVTTGYDFPYATRPANPPYHLGTLLGRLRP